MDEIWVKSPPAFLIIANRKVDCQYVGECENERMIPGIVLFSVMGCSQTPRRMYPLHFFLTFFGFSCILFSALFG